MNFLLRRKVYLALIFAVPLLFAGAPAAAQFILVPVDHQVYPLLHKAETLQLIDGYALRVLPADRGTVRRFLQQIDARKDRLSRADQRLLAQMLAEFTDPAIGREADPKGERHAWRYEEDSTQIFLDFRYTQNFTSDRGRVQLADDDVSESTLGAAIRVRFSQYLFAAMQAQNSLILGQNELEENFDSLAGRVLVTTGAAGFVDQATGYLAFARGPLRILAGRSTLSWGAGLFDNLALNLHDRPTEMIRASLNYRLFRFTWFHATLAGINPLRFLGGHRLDVVLNKKLQLSLYETIVYGNRGLDFGYFNPFVPYQTVEHYLGDRDNNVIGGDLTWRPAPGWRLYGELFIDDFSLDYPLGTYYGNKFAWLLGVQRVQPFGIKNLETTLTYTRVDPYVYTHGDSINTYSHGPNSIGSRLGPNADRVRLVMALAPHRDSRWQFRYDFIRKGRGDIFSPWQKAFGRGKGFLRGTIEYRHELSLSLRQQMIKDVFAGFDLLWQVRRNAGQTAGLHATERRGRFFLDINY